jgi:hypothetical protein
MNDELKNKIERLEKDKIILVNALKDISCCNGYMKYNRIKAIAKKTLEEIEEIKTKEKIEEDLSNCLDYRGFSICGCIFKGKKYLTDNEYYIIFKEYKIDLPKRRYIYLTKKLDAISDISVHYMSTEIEFIYFKTKQDAKDTIDLYIENKSFLTSRDMVL